MTKPGTTIENGWYLGRVVDPFGHHWEIGKPLFPSAPRPRRDPLGGPHLLDS